MGETTEIAWTHSTFNPWWGCVEVSPACDNCYARTDAKRYGHPVWGKDAPRRFFGDKHWNEPLRWNRAAEQAGERRRVFCASMADVFEDRDELKPHRARLWKLVEATPALDWLLLTKRPGNIVRFIQPSLLYAPNVWLGTTIEDRLRLSRLDVLRGIFAGCIKFVSIEPQIEDLGEVNWQGIDWLIIGGESGNKARGFHVAWARRLIAQARRDRAAPFVKQLGSNPNGLRDDLCDACSLGLKMPRRSHGTDCPGGRVLAHPKGGDPSEWPEDLRVREMPGGAR